MKFSPRTIAVALVAALPLATAAQTTNPSHSHDAAGGSKQMHDSMMSGMKGMQSMKMSGDTDRDFAMMMRKHHEDGVKMAQIEMEKGKDQKMKDMAQKIMEAQKKEIAEFDEWLKRPK